MVALALANGGYSLATRSVTGILVWWILGLGVASGLLPRARPSLGSAAAWVLLALFAAWTGLSIIWAVDTETAFIELDRVILYTGVLALVLLAVAPRSRASWADGLALGIVVAGILALSSRCFRGVFGPDDVSQVFGRVRVRLSYPVDYWNGLAVLMAIGVPLLLRGAAGARQALVRALAVTPIPMLAGVIYLTSSRAGIVAAVVGSLAFLALSDRRVAGALAGLVAAAGSAGAIGVLSARSALVNLEGSDHLIASQGHSAAALVLAICIAAGLLYGGLTVLFPPRRLSPPSWARVAIAATCLLVAAGAIAAANPGDRLAEFKKPPAASRPGTQNYVRSHLMSGGGTGRWQFWGAALHEFERWPLRGGGAGSYEAWWAERATITYYIRDAHSLYLETLGELGLVGLVLVIGAFLAGLGTAVWRALRWDRLERVTTAGAVGGFLAFAVAAGVDWMWEMTVVAVVGLACLGVAISPEGPLPSGVRRPRTWWVARALGAVLALGAAAAIALPMLSERSVKASQRAAARGDLEQARVDAGNARSLQPWASSPYLQAALVEERAGRLGAARRLIKAAIARDVSSWRLQLVAARIDIRAGKIGPARQALRRARRLNPRSPILRLAHRSG